jgi:hypothetical protein
MPEVVYLEAVNAKGTLEGVGGTTLSLTYTGGTSGTSLVIDRRHCRHVMYSGSSLVAPILLLP